MDNNIDLVLRARTGDEDAFSQLREQYKNLVVSMSRKYSDMCPEKYSVLDDFIQESEVAFYNAIMRYDAEGQKIKFGAFAKICIRNKLISYVRKLNSKKRCKGESDVWATQGESMQETVVRRELGEKLLSVVEGSLSKYEKRILSLYREGRSAKEISSIVCKSEKSVNNAIYRIRLKLKKTVL